MVDGNYKYIAAPRYLSPAESDLFYTKQRPLRDTLMGGQWQRYDYWNPPVREMLFNLETDPGETENLAATHPEQLERMRALLDKRQARSQREDESRFTGEDALTIEFVKNLALDAGMGAKQHPDEMPGSPSQDDIDILESLGYLGFSSEAHSSPNTPAQQPAP